MCRSHSRRPECAVPSPMVPTARSYGAGVASSRENWRGNEGIPDTLPKTQPLRISSFAVGVWPARARFVFGERFHVATAVARVLWRTRGKAVQDNWRPLLGRSPDPVSDSHGGGRTAQEECMTLENGDLRRSVAVSPSRGEPPHRSPT